jgi:hypothetical protein
MAAMMKWLAAALAVMLPLAALAQGGDADYCKALITKYETYANKASRGRDVESVDGNLAIMQCQAGNPAGIPVLEQKLKNAKIDLPARQ